MNVVRLKCRNQVVIAMHSNADKWILTFKSEYLLKKKIFWETILSKSGLGEVFWAKNKGVEFLVTLSL